MNAEVTWMIGITAVVLVLGSVLVAICLHEAAEMSGRLDTREAAMEKYRAELPGAKGSAGLITTSTEG